MFTTDIAYGCWIIYGNELFIYKEKLSIYLLIEIYVQYNARRSRRVFICTKENEEVTIN